MLLLQRCREILGPECLLSDTELQLLRDQLYGLADVIVTSFLKQKSHPEREKWEERAAIMEFDGGLTRTEAESMALNLLREGRNRPK